MAARKKVTRKKVTRKPAAKKALAKTNPNELSTNLSFEADSGAGMEGTDKDSFAIPFLAVIQKMSPQVDEADPKFIEEARPGMITNTVTDELFDGKEGVTFLPCAFQRRFLHWAARGQGGGFKGELSPEDATALMEDGAVENYNGRLYFLEEDGSFQEDKSDYLADTRNHFGILVNEATGQMTQVLLSLGSTQIKKSKQLMTLLNGVKIKGSQGMVTPPTWMNRVRITSVPESNEKGSWHGVRVELDGLIDSQDLYDAGRALHEIIATGKATVNYETVAEGSDEKF